MMKEPQYSGEIGLGGIFTLGFLGVDFFFVLSGFIILYVHWGDIATPNKLVRYGWRRLVRVLPTYWLIFAFALALNLLLQRDNPDVTLHWMFEQITLSASKLWLGPAWTLQHEMSFYLLFSLLIVSRFGFLILCAWFTTVGFLALGMPGFTGDNPKLTGWNSIPGVGLLLHPTNISFAFGMLVAYVARRAPNYLSALAASCLSAFALWTMVIDWSTFTWHLGWRYVWTSFGFTGVLAGLLVLSKRVSKIPNAFTFLGTISYSMYLVHVVPIGLTYALLAKFGFYTQMPQIAVFSIGVVTSLVAACICFYGFEKPLLLRMQNLVR
jgi:exopolysaccharide production protein ExoZ